jgi:hypothetical protein
MKLWLALYIGIGMYCTTASAADIYRWIDQDGRTQVSDVVPEQYKHSATRIDTRQIEKTDGPRSGVKKRADRETVTVETAEKNQAPNPTSKTPDAKDEGSSGTSISEADCAVLWRRYKESAKCWGRYNLWGGQKEGAAALAACGPGVPSPNSKCGFTGKNPE